MSTVNDVLPPHFVAALRRVIFDCQHHNQMLKVDPSEMQRVSDDAETVAKGIRELMPDYPDGVLVHLLRKAVEDLFEPAAGAAAAADATAAPATPRELVPRAPFEALH